MDRPVGHQDVERKAGCRGGKPIIRGTSFPVSAVGLYVLRHGRIPEELVKAFPHLTLAQVYDAPSYDHDHREDRDLLVAERVGEDTLARSLPTGEAFLRRSSPPEEDVPRRTLQQTAGKDCRGMSLPRLHHDADGIRRSCRGPTRV